MGLALVSFACTAHASPEPTALEKAKAVHDRYAKLALPDEGIGKEDDARSFDDTLADAIAEAYASNPLLNQRRYELRINDDELLAAKAETRASLRAEVSAGYQFIDPGRTTEATRPLADRLNSPFIRRNDLGGQVVASQPLLTGGRAGALRQAAERDIAAGRQGLRASEGDLLVSVITAYADVRQANRALAIRNVNEKVLERVLDEVIARREAGQLTRTDIAQAEAQLQAARALRSIAEADLDHARAVFATLVGRAPGGLAPEPPLPLVPGSIDEAFNTARQFNPDLAQAIEVERASRARIAVARSGYRPTLAVQGTVGTTGRLSPLRRSEEDFSWTGRATLTIPLFSGGRTAADVENALDRNSADRLGIEVARRQMVQGINDAWNQMVTAMRELDAQEAQLKAARIFYEGTSAEYRQGLRSTFDVLYAQNQLRDTEIAVLASQRDRYVATATLLRRIGQLEAGKILTGTPLYDPSAHFRRVADKAAQPFDAAITALDGIAPASQHQRHLTGPDLPTGRQAVAPTDPISTPDSLVDRDPGVPIPGITAMPQSQDKP